MGLRRIKQTVNFDNPKVYHLYYGSDLAEPGSVMTYFPFPGLARGRPGTGEVSLVSFSIPVGSLDLWEAHLASTGAREIVRDTVFGEACIEFSAPDGDRFRLVEHLRDPRERTLGTRGFRNKIAGFQGVTLCLGETESTAEILKAFGYQQSAVEGRTSRFELPGGNGASVVDLRYEPELERSVEGAGSVHHVAFAVKNREDQQTVREAMLTAGHRVTHVYDRNYFFAIYFRTPGGVLFEVATYEPGFDADEDMAHLGEALKLPAQHEHLRTALEEDLIPLD